MRGRIGDTDLSTWLEVPGTGRAYAVYAESKRRGAFGSKRWRRVDHLLVTVELWRGSYRTALAWTFKARTIEEVLRLARARATKQEQLERARASR